MGKPKTTRQKPVKSNVARLKTPESIVLKACMDVLEHSPIVRLWWRNNTGMAKFGNRHVRFGFPGSSDLMAVVAGGKFLAVEVKAPGEKPKPAQDAFLDNVADAGGWSVWVTDAEQLHDFLREKR